MLSFHSPLKSCADLFWFALLSYRMTFRKVLKLVRWKTPFYLACFSRQSSLARSVASCPYCFAALELLMLQTFAPDTSECPKTQILVRSFITEELS